MWDADNRVSTTTPSLTYLVMIPIIQRIAQIGIERVDVVQPRKVRENLSQPFLDGLLRELDLAHVKGTDALDFVSRVDDRGSLALGAHEDDVDQIGRRGHRGHLLEIVDGHGCWLARVVVIDRQRTKRMEGTQKKIYV